MNNFHKFIAALLTLVMGGVEASVPSARAAEVADGDEPVTTLVVSPPKAYRITNNATNLNLCVETNKVSIKADATAFLTPVTRSDGSAGGYIISNIDGEFICLADNSDWSLSTTTDINKAYILDMSLTKGVYTFKGHNSETQENAGNCFLGTDGTTDPSTVFADKPAPSFKDNNVASDEKHSAWKLSKVTSPRLLPAMYFEWSGLDGNAEVKKNIGCDYNIGKGDYVTIFGNVQVEPFYYADLTIYKSLIIEVANGSPRLFFNATQTGTGDDDRYRITVDEKSGFVTRDPNNSNIWVIDLEKITENYGFAHLNAIKGQTSAATANITSATLELYADHTQLDLTINVWRDNAIDLGYTTQTETVDFTDVCSFLDVNSITRDMLYVPKSDGSEVQIGFTMDGEKEVETVSDGWFSSGYALPWASNPTVCVKFFEAITNDGKYTICNMPCEPGKKQEGTHSARWIIKANNKVVNYTINVNFIPFAGNRTHNVMEKGKTPGLWEDREEKGVDEKNISDRYIKAYLGGWKYQVGNDYEGYQENGTPQEYPHPSALAGCYPKVSPYYQLHNFSNGINKDGVQWDYWKKSKQQGGPNEITDIQQATIDNTYKYGSFGNDNARSEFLWGDTDGFSYNGPFDNALRGQGMGNPFTVPCFGTFLKFEPKCNGKVIAYVIQNGVIDMSTSSEVNDIQYYGLTNSIGWRPMYIVDEAGNCLPENDGSNTNGVMAETNQRIYVGMDHTQSVDGQPYSYWVNEYFNNGKGKDHLVLKKYWKASGEKQEILPPSVTGDGWIAISKAYIKYTFDVKAGKSYYMFSNDTKLAYCGYEFIPTNIPSEQETLSETENWQNKASNNAGKSYQTVTVQRTLQPGWNAICLPFSVTEEKMRDLFGTTKNGVKQETYELVTYNGAEPISGGYYLRAHFFRHAYQDIIAWYPYMLYIDKSSDLWKSDAEKNSNKPISKTLTFSNVTFEPQEDIAIYSSTQYMPSESGFYNIAMADDYVFRGQYYQGKVADGSYLVTPSGIQYYKTGPTLNGLRSYLDPNTRKSSSEMKVLSAANFSNVLDDAHWEDATVINALVEEMGLFSNPSDVYHVSGLLVRKDATSLVGLPKGIYIVNGKKYFVK